MKKQVTAILAALVMTACVGAAILAVGGAALFNKNGVQPQNSQAQVSASTSADAAQLAQLQELVSQYQQREQEYQSREKQYQQQLEQANSLVQSDQQQLQQVQLLLMALQQRGLITINGNGQVFINQ